MQSDGPNIWNYAIWYLQNLGASFDICHVRVSFTFNPTNTNKWWNIYAAYTGLSSNLLEKKYDD